MNDIIKTIMQKITRTKKGKNILKFIVLALLIGGAMTSAYFVFLNNRAEKNNVNNGINYAPPSEDEKAAGDQIKNEIDKKEENENSGVAGPNLSKKTVSVIITDASQYDNKVEVRSFIPNHFHDGTCIIKFTKLNYELTKKTPAYRDVSSTICTNPDISRSEFQENGDWKVEVKYESEDAEGVSETQTVTIN